MDEVPKNRKSRLIALVILLLIFVFGMLMFVAGYYVLGFPTALLTVGSACIYFIHVVAEENFQEMQRIKQDIQNQKHDLQDNEQGDDYWHK
ncbi:MAG: hypothetical protein OFPI_35510 [Osedax symbiont Rs2]|nr:MAG: hypothetical protein OFPI_35510 [Osedax symbiont Rs2]